jgi:hypothetical protein
VSTARAVAVPAPKPIGAHRPNPGAAPLDSDAFDRAAEARLAESATHRMRDGQRRGTGRYQETVPAKPGRGVRPASTPSIFGNDTLRGKSLDEVILSYLSDDVGESER